MTSATQAHTLRVYCSLPRKESLLLWASGKQEVECDVGDGRTVQPTCTLTYGARLGRSAAAACGGWGAVVTGLAAPWPPSSFPVVDSSIRPNRESGQAESMRWKQNGKGDVQMTKTSWRTFCLNKRFSPVAMGIRL